MGGLDGKISVLDACDLTILRSFRASPNFGGVWMIIAVHKHILFTTSQSENRAAFWNLETAELLTEIDPLGSEMRPGQFTPMVANFTSSGALGLTSSNDCDDPTLCLLLHPQGWQSRAISA